MRFVFLLLLAFASLAHAQQQPGDSLTVSLITVAPGEVYWERFGHNAIRIQDASGGSDVLYNYGIFDFEQENFLLNFLRGYMTYRVAVWPTSEDLGQYVREGREIREQVLNLTSAQRARLRDFLADNVKPQNAEYRYDYFERNCATRVRDALDDASDHAIFKSVEGRARGFTYRMHALRLTAADLPLALGIHVGLGPYADRRIDFWDELFVPMELARHLREVRVDGAPLVASETVLSPSRIAFPDDAPPEWRWRFIAAGLALAAILFGLARARSNTAARIAFALLAGSIALLLGLGGVLLAGLWAATEHRSAWANENLALFDPLWLLLVPALFASARAAWRPRAWHAHVAAIAAFIAGAELFCKVFPAFFQDNGDWIALWLPVALALAWALRRRVAA